MNENTNGRTSRTESIPTPLTTRLHGFSLLGDSFWNKGMAFSEAERDAFGLHGLLPPHVATLEEQMARRLAVFRSLPEGFHRYSFMRDLQDVNETLFYALLLANIAEMLPVVYTPIVGEGCQRFSEIWRKPRGLFLSYPNRDRMEEILAHPRYNQVRAIVVSDGERILGLGDQGAGGMGIPIGKMALYTALAGIHPRQCLPILLDVGTDNMRLLEQPIYVGWRHARVRGAEYDAFVERFVQAVNRRWPHVLLQWEDFAGANAGCLLDRYRDRLCTFNDDIQGTAAVATATLLAALSRTGRSLREQKIAIVGFGAAGQGIAGLLGRAMEEEGLSRKESRARLWAVDREGLLVADQSSVTDAQRGFARARDEVAGWKVADPGRISLEEVVEHVTPTVLIGVSGQPGAFSEAAVRRMAAKVERPVIFPLSNPTARAEATPADLLEWTDGRAILGTGSPFPPVVRGGRTIAIDQTNNSYIFPGLALGILASRADRVSDNMIMSAARALAGLSPVHRDRDSRLLPPLEAIRGISREVALAVGRQAQRDGLAEVVGEQQLLASLDAAIWEPVYRPYIPQ